MGGGRGGQRSTADPTPLCGARWVVGEAVRDQQPTLHLSVGREALTLQFLSPLANLARRFLSRPKMCPGERGSLIELCIALENQRCVVPSKAH